VTLAREDARDIWIWRWLDAAAQDLRSAVRQIRRNQGFAAAVVVTLVLGVGAVTAVLTVADPILFRALPFPHSDRLFVMSGGLDHLHVPDEVRAETAGGAFENVGEFHGPVDIGPIGTATAVSISYAITPGLLPALGVAPVLGRTFRDDEYDSRADVALITDTVWRDVFGGRPDVLTERLTFTGSGGHTYQIVGVLPRSFFLPDRINEQPAVLIPRRFDLSDPRYAQPNSLSYPIARLEAGVSVAAAAAQMQGIMRGVEQDYPAFERNRRVHFTPLRDSIFGDVRTPVAMLLAATLCILLLASANLAQLTTARLRARRREFGVRRAIGASRWRLVRQLSIEVLLLAIAGGIAAFAAGGVLSRLAMAHLPWSLHAYQIVPPVLDWRIAIITGSIVLGTLAVFGIAPAIRASFGEVRDTIEAAPRDNHVHRIVGSDPALIFVQTTAAVALLVTGLLIVRSFLTLAETRVGFDSRGVVEIAPDFPDAVSRDGPRLRESSRQLYETLRSRLGGQLAAAGGLPGRNLNTALTRLDAPVRLAPVEAWPVSGTFFDVMRITIVRGRVFTDQEAFSNAPVAVVDQRAANLLWPGADPIGRAVKELDGTPRTIVGVVQTVRSDLIGVGFQRGSGFVPFGKSSGPLSFLSRAPGGPATDKELQAVAAEIEPGTTVSMHPLEVFERQLAQPRFLAIVLGTLTAIAVLLTFVGVFAIVMHEVGQRTKELGIRIALGADADRIRRLVLRGALIPAVGGGLAGLSASLWFTGALRSLLIGVSPYDPVVYGLTLLLTLAIVTLASMGPAHRASHTDPIAALKTQ
ncbi:MAG: FtsX-like permease family protein, partial [Vicinamibacterales bacterium]